MRTSINKKFIFATAWKMVKTSGISLSVALSKAWEYARKEANKLVDVTIVTVTQKAIGVSYNGVILWFGKSILVNGKVPYWAFEQKVNQLSFK